MSLIHREVNVKGQAFHSVLAALQELKGEPFRKATMQACTGELGDAFRSRTLLPSGWYPVSWYRELFRSALSQPNAKPALAREIGLTSGRREVRGVYRVMFRMLATETMVRQAPRFFKLFYSSGRVDVRDVKPGSAIVDYTGCHGFDRSVWEDLLGGAQAAFEATGAKAMHVRILEGGRDGDDSMLISVRWRA